MDDEFSLGEESTPVSLESILKEKSKDHEYCWGCEYGFGSEESQETKALWNLFQENKLTVDDNKLARMISQSHYDLFVLPFKDEIDEETGEKIKSKNWPSNVVLRHIRVHMIDRDYDLSTMIKRYRGLEESFDDCVFSKDSSGTKRGDHKNLQCIVQLGKLRAELYNKLSHK